MYNVRYENHNIIEEDWRILWNLRGPHYIQSFIWLVAHDCILKYYRRIRWGVGIYPTSPCCGMEEEITLHVLRGCIYTTQVWIKLVPFDWITKFFTFDCRNWVFNNLNRHWNGIPNSR